MTQTRTPDPDDSSKTPDPDDSSKLRRAGSGRFLPAS